jgi:hypothetical protein
MMEAVRTSETSVNIYLTTRQYIPEDSKLHTSKMLAAQKNGEYELMLFMSMV